MILYTFHLPNLLDTAIAMNKTNQSNDVSSGKYYNVKKKTQLTPKYIYMYFNFKCGYLRAGQQQTSE